MNGPQEPGTVPSRSAVLLDMERLCDEFEAAWRAGQHPQIEDVLAREPPARRGELLEKLLEIELEMQSLTGETLSLGGYRRRFPEDAARLESVYRRVVPCRRLGDYELLEQIGRGGMGEVYQARQVHLNQIVALKLLPERYLEDRQAVARFRQEMRSIGVLDHPNIVRAYNAGEADGRHFLVMEYVAGIDLQRLVESRRRPLRAAAACEVIRQAALGLQHAHEHGLVHRDLKPANLIVNRAGLVKILDFGLARFDSSTLTLQLSQEGLALGTADYMAPEQVENSSAVDVRADIYSLGCTLFFLLTGRPPYADPMYDTLRKRLKAHAMAPIPALAEACPGCPADLDRILRQMMAKKSDDRFDSLGELADAVGLFAEPRELRACATKALAVVSPAESLSPGTSGPRGELTAAQSGDTGRVRSKSRRPPWHRRRLSLVAVLGAMVLGSVLASWWDPRHPPMPDVPEEAAESVSELALLPGLNGQWWFDEMPWYVPFVRQAVAETLTATPDAASVLGSGATDYLQPNVAEVQQRLWQVAAGCSANLTVGQRRLLKELRELAGGNLSDAELVTRLDASLQQFVQHHKNTDWSAVDLHTQALLQHKLAALRSDRGQARTAEGVYQSALKRYAQTDAVAAPLHLLCLADAALLQARVLGNYEEAQRLFDRALPPGDRPLLFAAETRVTYGTEAANAGRYRDDLFATARKLLDEAGVSKGSHPLAAAVCERYAWSLLDQWQVDEASKQFTEAYSIRGANQRAANPFATIHLFHNRHGKAVALRYGGDPESARRVFKALVGDQILVGSKGVPGELQAALTDAESQSERPGQQRYLRDLRLRWANSMERWADCELYGGAASGAPVNLARASMLYDRARILNADLDKGTEVVLACKLCLALALHGQIAEARRVFDRSPANPQDILGPDRERASLLRQVAAAVLQLKADAQQRDEGQKALRGFLDQFKLNPNHTDSRRRETLELQLFCAELLLRSELEAQQQAAAQRDCRYLESLLAHFRGRGDMRRFLRRYYDLALAACDRSDLVQMAQYLVAARAVERQEAIRCGTLLLFHFTPRENLAIYLPQDGRPSQLFPLTLTREQIKKAASRRERLRLDDALVRLVQGDLQARRPVDAFWSDAVCWGDEDEGLADSDWPFADQLDPAALFRKAR
jgi:serine/threonine protein kinase